MQIDRPIATAIIVFVIVILIFFLVSPEYKTFQKLRQELGVKTAEFNAEFDYYAEITKAYYDLKSRQDVLEKIDNALPQDPNLGKLVYFFQKTAEENGMIIKNLFLSKSSASESSSGKSAVNNIVFSIDLLGDYSSLGNFIVSLERSARIFEVINISFGSESVSQAALSGQFQTQQTHVFSLQIQTHSY